MRYKKPLLLALLFIFYPIISSSDENIGKSKIFVEKLGKQVVEKISNTEISEQEIPKFQKNLLIIFRQLLHFKICFRKILENH